MRRILSIFVLALTVLTGSLSAQNCTYTLELFDSFGDGWNGASLEVSVAGVATPYTVPPGGDFSLFCFEVNEGDEIILNYSGGTFENEVTYNVISADGVIIFNDGPNPAIGNAVFTATASCPSCPAPSQCSVEFTELGPFMTNVNFDEVGSASGYIVEYGPVGFTPGTGTVVSGAASPINLPGLTPETNYEVYITSDCSGETSPAIGPFAFMTTVSCPVPTEFTVGTITASSAMLAWLPNGVSLDHNLEYGVSGFTLGTGTTVTANGALTTVTGLDENTIYEVYLQTNCGPGDVSQWVGPISFQTDFINPPTSCTWSIELTDASNFGWNNANVALTINSITTTYTLNNVDDDGQFAVFQFEVLEGFPIEAVYTASFFDNGHSYQIKDPDGVVVFEDAGPAPQEGLVYEGIGYCPVCPAPNPQSVNFTNVTGSSATVNWAFVGLAQDYIIEYGPAGYPQGAGIMVNVGNTNAYNMTGLNPGVTYEVYVTSVCDIDGTNVNATTIGPFSTSTIYTGGAPCNYTLNLFDSFGDGWNGSQLTVSQCGVETSYTIPPGGDAATFTVETFANIPLAFSYSPGTFEGEVTFEILNSDGVVVYSDGPNPATGLIFTDVACPTCMGPSDLAAIDVNANNMTIGWVESNLDPGSMTLEYGSIGFTLGEGTAITPSSTTQLITGLTENTYYNVYLSYTCDNGEQAKTLGPLTLHTLHFVDVAVTGLDNPDPSTACNLSADEIVSILMTNFGQTPATLIPFGFSVNGQVVNVPMPEDGFYTGVIGNDSTEVVEFEIMYDFSEPGTYVIEAWTALEDDTNMSNDTFTTVIQTAEYLPVMEDFEDGAIDDNWTTNAFFYNAGDHNLPSAAIGRNLFGTFSSFNLTTNRVGPIAANSELTFDYRYAIWFAGTEGYAIQGDSLVVEISTDCGENFDILFAVDQTNHVVSADMATVTVDLSAYEGDAIDLRFRAVYASGDYWLDMDNINISGCPPTLGLSGVVSDASQPGQADGSIQISTLFGTDPYTFEWDNGADGALLENIEGNATYSVLVTDVNGCSDALSFNVGNITSVEESTLINTWTLAPNPTLGEAMLNLDMNEASDLRIEVFNGVGQLMNSYEYFNTKSVQEMIDLNDQPAGVYYIRVSANGQSQVKKLMVTRA